jgi:EAL domain-containing protein (putative c-di-GMP-specific phosphodiesterase class I)
VSTTNEALIYEVFFRPSEGDCESYYDSLSPALAAREAKKNLGRLASLFPLAIKNLPKVGALAINLECSSLSFVKYELCLLYATLEDLGINLAVEITERERVFDAEALSNIKFLYDLGIQVFIDDLTVEDLKVIRVDSPFITGIKIKYSDIIRFDKGFSYIEELICLGKEVVIENIENVSELMKSVEAMATYVQGYYIGRPQAFDV